MLDYVNEVVVLTSPRRSEKEYKLIYEYFNIYYPKGWIIYLEGANPPEILLAGAGVLNINKYFDMVEAKPRLKQLEEEMIKLRNEENIC